MPSGQTLTRPRPGIRLAYLTSQFPIPSATFILNELIGMRKRGFTIDMISIRRPRGDAFAETLEREKISVEYLLPVTPVRLAASHGWALIRSPWRYVSTLIFAARRRPRGLRRWFYMVFYFAEAIVLAKRLHSREISHLHVHHANNATTVAMLTSRYLGVPYSFTAHGSDILIEKDLLREKVENARFVVTISEYNRAMIRQYCDASRDDRVEVVRIGVDTNRLRPSRNRIGELPQVLSVGRLIEIKAFDDLIRACAVLRDRGARFRCVIVGDGPHRGSLDALRRELRLESHVSFAGTVSPEELGGYLDGSDLFALASTSEGIPVVLMEAMACGLPVVATRITGIPELVEDGVSGYLVRPRCPEDLASAMTRLLDSPDRGAGMGAKGRDRVVRLFDAKTNLDGLARTFRRRLAGVQ